jgi:hypothetical protein
MKVVIFCIKGISERITEVKGFSDRWVADGWAAREEQPTHLPPHPSLLKETPGTQRVNKGSPVPCLVSSESSLTAFFNYLFSTQG